MGSVKIAGIDGFENGGLHPDGSTAFTTPSNGIIRVSNVTDSGTNPDLSSNTDSRWIDLGYAAGGYTGSSGTGIGGIGRNHSGIWAKVLTEAAVNAKRDHLLGLKENVIVGHKIPAGTG